VASGPLATALVGRDATDPGAMVEVARMTDRSEPTYWQRKKREALCWLLHFGHPDVVVHGGAGGWEVWECARCHAYRVGPLDFFNREVGKLSYDEMAGAQGR
jgi:hypothetical protein